MNRTSVPENRILMITYAFPPVGYVGAFRTLKYCKYLRDYGWRPIVLTIRPTHVRFKDQNLSRQIPDHVAVYRTFDLDPAKWLVKRWLAKRARLRDHETKPETSRAGRAGDAPEDRRPGIWRRFKKMVIALLTDCPDSHVFWVPFAFLKGVWILLLQKVDVIYSSSPPHSTHMITFLLAKCFRKPYVLDFRDPWHTEARVKRPIMDFRWLWNLEIATKRAIIRGASKVICVTRGERDQLRAEFPGLPEDKFGFITNGYDPSDFGGQDVEQTEKSTKLVLTHAGTIYGGIGDELFDALHRLLEQHPQIAESLQVNLLGEIADDYMATVRNLEKSGMVAAYGLQPHATALRMVQQSDVLVILMGGDEFLPSHVPAKLFEYLYAGKPILAVTREGNATEILRESGLGVIVAPRAIDQLVKILVELQGEHVSGRLRRAANRGYIESFERRALAKSLAIILNEVNGGMAAVTGN